MISIEIQDRKYPFGHPTQPSALWNCSLSLCTLLTVLFSPVINDSDNEFPWKIAQHQWLPLLWTGTGITSSYREEDFKVICAKGKQRKQPKESYEFIPKSPFFEVENPQHLTRQHNFWDCVYFRELEVNLNLWLQTRNSLESGEVFSIFSRKRSFRA